MCSIVRLHLYFMIISILVLCILPQCVLCMQSNEAYLDGLLVFFSFDVLHFLPSTHSHS